MLINLNYEQALLLRGLLVDNAEDSEYLGIQEILHMVEQTIQSVWRKGNEITPMFTDFIVEIENQGEFVAKRLELVSSYSPKQVELLLKQDNGSWRIVTLNAAEFVWRNI